MAITFKCDCGQVIQANDRMAGKVGRCPNCGRDVSVPRAHPPSSTSTKIRFLCGCGKRLTVPAAWSSKSVKCPNCGRKYVVPERAPDAAPTPPAGAKTADPADSWKLPVGIVLLVAVGVPMLLFAALLNSAMCAKMLGLSGDSAVFLVMLAIPYTLAVALVGWPIQRRCELVGKFCYCVLFSGILPGIIILKAWEAIGEGWAASRVQPTAGRPKSVASHQRGLDKHVRSTEPQQTEVTHDKRGGLTSWLEAQIAQSSIALLVLFALMCPPAGLIAGIMIYIVTKGSGARERGRALCLVGGIITLIQIALVVLLTLAS